MSWFNKTSVKTEIDWIDLNSMEQLNEIVKESQEIPVAIFKHSTRCAISSMAKSRLERNWDMGESVKMYYLDLIRYRDISNQIAGQFNVEHQSPQIILIKNGEVVYHDSHSGIEQEVLKNNL